MTDSNTRPSMGIFVGSECVGAAVAPAEWDGDGLAVQYLHEESWTKNASHLARVEFGVGAGRRLAEYARGHGVAAVTIEAPEREVQSVAHNELSAVVVAELLRAGLDVRPVPSRSAAALIFGERASDSGFDLRKALDELTEPPRAACAVQRMAFAVLQLARQQSILNGCSNPGSESARGSDSAALGLGSA